jgi:hypothetical protein
MRLNAQETTFDPESRSPKTLNRTNDQGQGRQWNDQDEGGHALVGGGALSLSR